MWTYVCIAAIPLAALFVLLLLGLCAVSGRCAQEEEDRLGVRRS
jgi:hypothetical protein